MTVNEKWFIVRFPTRKLTDWWVISSLGSDGKVGKVGGDLFFADKARKDLHQLFDEFQLKITAEITHQSVNFLDITLN
jgi:hypothetical protein